MSLLERYPVLKKAVANQYQAILAGGAIAFSALLANPLPLIIYLAGNLMVMPMLVDRLRRRIEIEKKYADRKFEVLSNEQRYAELPGAARERFERLRALCAQIQNNYRGLSAASQGMLADQAGKFDAILGTCLRRLWLLRKYQELGNTLDPHAVAAEIERLEKALDQPDLDRRVREAWEQNLAIKRKLGETAAQNRANEQALVAELDSLEALLQLLLQKSLAATDAGAFTLEIDDVLAQAEADAASVHELEQMLGSMPDLGTAEDRASWRLPPLPEAPGAPPLLPAAGRGRERGGRRG